MRYGKRLFSLLLVVALCFGLGFQSQASEIQKQKDKKEQLEKDKKAVEKKQKTLESELTKIVTEMETTKAEIEDIEEQLSEKEEELMAAKVEEDTQYEAMKKRIKYMYESGDTNFIDILCDAGSIGELLNKVEYISTISDYDREKLEEFQEIVHEIEEQEQMIQSEYDKLEKMQKSLIKKQDEVENLLEEMDLKISELADDIGETEEEINDLIKAAEEAARKQQEANSGYSSNAGESVVSGNGMFTHPCPGYRRISSYFGYREAPLAGASTNHKGVDFAAAQGTPIYAADSGTVVQAHYSGNAGNFIIINHGNGYSTYYMHCYQMYVKAGDKVSRGQNIASVGTTGNSTGPHLHFQVMKGSTPVNPLNYL